jgi:hypothetical protein
MLPKLMCILTAGWHKFCLTQKTKIEINKESFKNAQNDKIENVAGSV